MAELVWNGKQTFQASVNSDYASASSYFPFRLVTDQLYVSTPPIPDPVQNHTDWYNRLLHADRTVALGLLLPEFAGCVDLVYIDPPFMTGRTFNQGADIAYRDTWRNNLDTYLQWLYETLVLLYALLADDGSLYIHLDWRTIHYAKIMLDEIFGANTSVQGGGFKNEIIWHYQSGGRARKYYARKHDTLLFYTKSAHYCFHSERVAPRRGAGRRNHMRKEVAADGRVTWTIRTGGRVYSYDEDVQMSPADVWSDISHLHQKDPERTGYATQKPEALLERILLASSEEDDLVLDCFSGSGVTAAVAERLGRRWLACDSSELAIATTCTRLRARPHRAFALQRGEKIPDTGPRADVDTLLL